MSFSNFKVSINLANENDVSKYLRGFVDPCEERAQLEAFLVLTLERALKKDARYMEELEDMPKDAPEWMRKKWGESLFHTFVANPKLDQKVTHVRDWLLSSIRRDEEWLSALDNKGRPLKLMKIGSVEQAYKEAEKDRITQAQKRGNSGIKGDAAFEYELEHNDIAIVKEFDDGYKMVEILTKVGATREAFLMHHCLVDGAYDDLFSADNPETGRLFYSLRDYKNEPHVTFELNLEDKEIVQCVGKQNLAPKPKYIPMVQMFCYENGLVLEQLRGAEHIFRDGEFYPIRALPDDFVHKDNLDLRGLLDFKCPENLMIEGNLSLEAPQRSILKKSLGILEHIFEYELVKDGLYKCTEYCNKFEKIYGISWWKDVNEQYVLHRIGAPAMQSFNPETKNVVLERWYVDGLLHRQDGPAITSWSNRTGKKKDELYFEVGQIRPHLKN